MSMRLLLLVFLCTAFSEAFSQPSARVLEIDPCAPFVEVDEPGRFRIADRIVIHQTLHARTDTLASAGMWETALVEDILGGLLFVDRPLSVPFDPAAGVQVVRADTAPTLVIGQRIGVRPFQDGRGGLYAACADTLILNSPIDATGCGYAGGRRSIGGWDTTCTLDSVDLLSGAAGGIGQGPILSTGSHAGRGSVPGGGGGGNARNSGGGGGGLGGAGGGGGSQTSAYEVLPLGGHGGTRIAAPVARFGGGGGGGHQNDFSGSNGGAGGGAVILRARVIVAEPGAAILASGASGTLAWNDGAGGGGAGGTVILIADTVIGRLPVTVEGGQGGPTLGEWYCYGPGGGGGGGVLVASAKVVDAVALNAAGGAAGTAVGVGPCESAATYGASAGTDGVVLAPSAVDQFAAPCRQPDIVVRGGTAEGRPGDRVEVPIDIEVLTSLERSLRLTLWIRARASVLVPEGAFRWAGRHAAVRFHTISLPAGPPRTITDAISYTCALGDSAEVIVRFDTVFTDDSEIRASIASHGRFRVHGICDAGGRSRLFDPFSAAGARGEVRTEIYDLNGRRVEDREIRDWRLNAPGSPGTRLIVPR